MSIDKLNQYAMKLKLILSLLLLTLMYTAFSQKKQNNFSLEKGLIKVSILYPYAEGKTFDMEYYKTKHMPMVANIVGSNMVRYTIEKGLANGMPNQPLPFIAIGTFYIKNLNDYNVSLLPKMDAIREDLKKFTDIIPITFISEVVR